ncbi:MAG TPA: SEC-C metal-binding domain-containing protein, partial [Hyphomicrobiaceae bacterium]|nr:SEC-C metal-binding domain-containing protein [Hyphomicrobiaceae bacterium]
TPTDLNPHLNLPRAKIIASVKALSFPNGNHNSCFKALCDFNAVNAWPILTVDEDRFILFHWNALAEALYESPFYWLAADKSYFSAAFEHRGAFTEAFAFQRLSDVFGAARAYQGVIIEEGKDRLGEIDVLVLFGDRAIVVQAKSKRLTLEARRGNDLRLRGDFQAAVQDAYDQAMNCAEAFSNPSVRFVASDGTELAIPAKLTQIFPICLVADHYPALAFQADEFLVRRQAAAVLAPLIIDIFTLDAMAEMLDRPLRFLSYLELRALHGSKVHINHETALLSYHLKYNLWLDGDYDMVDVGDDFAADLEIAMSARRLVYPGKRTPDGILTLVAGRKLDEIIAAIEAKPFGPMIDLVLLVFQLSGTAMKELADAVDWVLDCARQKGSSDFSIGFAGSGLTVHANFSPLSEGKPCLERHMAFCKYRGKAESWYGLSLSPINGAIRVGIKAAFPWTFDAEIDSLSKRLGKKATRPPALRSGTKLGRNDPCHCGSGKKYKNCHLAADTRR